MKFIKKILILAVLFVAVYVACSYGLYGQMPTFSGIVSELKHDFSHLHSDSKVSPAKRTIDQMKPLLTNQTDVVSRLRDQLTKRHERMVFYYCSPQKMPEKYARQLYHEAIVPTDESNEGDYIRYQVARITMTTTYFRDAGKYYYTLNYQASYRTNAVEEKQVDEKVAAIVRPIQGYSETDQIRYLNNYLVDHVRYDAKDKDCFSAYGALIKGKAVCQGYTLAMYRLLKACHIDNRMITGVGITDRGRAAHSWNIIRVGNLYYDQDVTWNDSRLRNRYCLIGSRRFDRNHLADETFQTHQFKREYPIASQSYNL